MAVGDTFQNAFPNKTQFDAIITHLQSIAENTNPTGGTVLLTGYEKAAASAPVAATDLVNIAVGKLEFRADMATDERLTASLTNSAAYPFSNSGVTLNMTAARANTNYEVTPEVVSYTGGGVGDVEIYDKQTNGFKVRHTGAATAVSVVCHVRGGLE